MIAEQPTTARVSRRNRPIPAAPTTQQQLDVPGALWRYRWALVLPALVGGVLGFLVYSQLEETYRSSTRLMVESNRPPIFDALTGEVVGGVPDIEVLQWQLYSDEVAEMAFTDPNMTSFRELYGNSLEQFTIEVQQQLTLEPEVTDVKSAQSLITLLHFDSADMELCEIATQAYSKALQKYYDKRHKNTQQELSRLINIAIKSLNPKLTEKERLYGEFRRDAPLSWDEEGKVFNPHRVRHMSLTERRSALIEELRRVQTVFQQMKTVSEQTSDPRITLNVMSQLLGAKVGTTSNPKELDPIDADGLLKEIDFEKKLLPLIAERNQLESQYGASHPSVKALDDQVNTMRDELLRLVREETDRIAKLRSEWFEDMGDPIERAKEMVDGVLYSHDAKVKMTQQLINELDEQIAHEKEKAAELSKFELKNEEMIREMERLRDFMQQLEEKMSQVQLSDEESVTQIVELWAPSKAYLVGPSILKTAGLGTLLGILLGGGLALLLEKNADTFREPDEISTLLGVAILTHIPFFRGKRRKLKKGEVDPYKALTTDLAVVHQPASITAEAIRSLRTAVFFDTSGIKGGKVIQITSPLPGDGKSTISCNLACSIAQSGKRVLAIDCDLRRPQLTDNFDCDGQLGLTNVLNGECDPLDAAHATPLPKLSIMPCGPIPSNPAEALSLPVMNELLDYLREQFDYIVLDTPPLLVVTDPSITASMADALIMTLRIRRKSKPNAREALNILQGVGANVLGVVINNSEESNSADGYKGYGYYRYGRYGGHYYRRGQAEGTSVSVSTDSPLRRTRTSSSVSSAKSAGSGKNANKNANKNGSALKAAAPVRPQSSNGPSSNGPSSNGPSANSASANATMLIDQPQPEDQRDLGEESSNVEPPFDA